MKFNLVFVLFRMILIDKVTTTRVDTNGNHDVEDFSDAINELIINFFSLQYSNINVVKSDDYEVIERKKFLVLVIVSKTEILFELGESFNTRRCQNDF